MIEDNHFPVLKREFLICDVAQGQIGDTPILSKRNPPVWNCHGSKEIIKCISAIKGAIIPYFSLKFDLTFIRLSHRGKPFIFL